MNCETCGNICQNCSDTYVQPCCLCVNIGKENVKIKVGRSLLGTLGSFGLSVAQTACVLLLSPQTVWGAPWRLSSVLSFNDV